MKNLLLMLAPAFRNKRLTVPVIKTVALENKGIKELYEQIVSHILGVPANEKHCWLLAEKAYALIQQKRMRGISKIEILDEIKSIGEDFNLYRFVENY